MNIFDVIEPAMIGPSSSHTAGASRAGLVEVPCVKRNATGAAIALTSAEMALVGIKSVINADEVITAMKSVDCMMHEHLRETSLGGIAVSPTAKEIEKNLYKYKFYFLLRLFYIISLLTMAVSNYHRFYSIGALWLKNCSAFIIIFLFMQKTYRTI